MEENLVIPTDIAGVFIQPLGILPTPGGAVLHMLRSDYGLAPKGAFGEIYFSEVLPEAIKAWKRHKHQTQRLCVPIGKIKIVLLDARTDSDTAGNLLILELGRPDHYNLLLIPPGIWYGFSGISPNPSLICNYADHPHTPEEYEKLDFESPEIPFRWETP